MTFKVDLRGIILIQKAPSKLFDMLLNIPLDLRVNKVNKSLRCQNFYIKSIYNTKVFNLSLVLILGFL